MRILIDMLWSSVHNPSTDGSRTWFRGFVKPWIEQRTDDWFFVALPAWAEWRSTERRDLRADVEEAFDDVLPLPNVEPIWTQGWLKQYREAGAFLPEFRQFDMVGGTYPWLDAVVTGRIPALPQLIAETESYFRNGSATRRYVTVPHFVFDDETGRVGPALRQLQALGWAMADVNLESSPIQAERIMLEARRWLSPAQIVKMRESIRLWQGGLPVHDVTGFGKPLDQKRQDMPIVIWAGGLETDTDLTIFDDYDAIYSAGHKLILRVHSSSLVGESIVRRKIIPEQYLRWIEFYGRMPQDRYWQVAAEGHVHHVERHREDQIMVANELTMLGVLPVIAAKRNTKAQNSFVKGYPYTYTTREERRALLRHLLVDGGWRTPEAQTWLSKQQDFLRSVSGAAHWPLLRDELERLMATPTWRRHGIINLVAEATADTDEMTFSQFSRRISAFSKSGQFIDETFKEGTHGLSRGIYRNALLLLGWRDTCTTREPHFVRDLSVDPDAALNAALALVPSKQTDQV